MDRRYLIINAFSRRNAGDAAIVLSTAALLGDAGAKRVAVATRYHHEDFDFYAEHAIDAVAPPVAFGVRTSEGRSPLRAATLVASASLAVVIAVLFRVCGGSVQRFARAFRLSGLTELLDSHRVIICGGGYLYSARRAVNLTLLHICLCVKVASVAGKRPLMMPQSFGPFQRRVDRLLVRWAFSGVDPLVARDSVSLQEIRGAFSASAIDRTELEPDIAFYGWGGLSSRRDKRGAKFTDVPSVGIVAMDWTWARKVDSDRALASYVTKLSLTARAMAERGVDVRIYGHSRMAEIGQDDLAVARRVEERAAAVNVRVDPLGLDADPDQLARLFSRLDLLIGTRLHSCIIALVAGTPAIALAYQPKTEGTFKTLRLEELCLDVETFDAAALDALARPFVLEHGAHGRHHSVQVRVAQARSRLTRFYGYHLEGLESPADELTSGDPVPCG